MFISWRVQMSELNWIKLNWIELNWIELNWIELHWIELNRELSFIPFSEFRQITSILFRSVTSFSTWPPQILAWHWICPSPRDDHINHICPKLQESLKLLLKLIVKYAYQWRLAYIWYSWKIHSSIWRIFIILKLVRTTNADSLYN